MTQLPANKSHYVGSKAVWPMVAGLLLLALLHVVGWVPRAPDTDPVNFLMSLEGYSIADDRPHPAGYPAFVGLANLAALLVGKARAFQLVNLVLLLLCTAGLYWGLKDGIGKTRAAAVTLLFASHPVVWAATVIPECYISDGVMAVTLLNLGLFLGRQGPHMALTWAIFFVLSLFRAVSAAVLIPLLLCVVLVQAGPTGRWRTVVLTAGAAVAGIACGYLLTVHLGGGFETYAKAANRVMGNSFRGYSVLGGAPWRSHLAGIAACLVWFTVILTAALVPMHLLSALMERRRPMLQWPEAKWAWITAAWLVPILGFYLVIYYLKPTYHLIYLPAIMMVAVLTIKVRQERSILMAAVVLAAAQLALHFWGPAQLPTPLYRLTQTYFDDRTEVINQLEADLKIAQAGRDDTLVAWSVSYDVLPMYTSRILAPRQNILVSLRDDRVGLLQLWWNTWHGAPTQPTDDALLAQLTKTSCVIIVARPTSSRHPYNLLMLNPTQAERTPEILARLVKQRLEAPPTDPTKPPTSCGRSGRVGS